MVAVRYRMEIPMRKYVALIHRGPQWLWGRSVYEQGQPIEEHLQAMREHFDSGVLLLGGPFDEDGGIALLEVPDEQTAHDVMQADPAVVAGVITYEMRSLRPSASENTWSGARKMSHLLQ